MSMRWIADLFAPFLGGLTDRWGRRVGGLAFLLVGTLALTVAAVEGLLSLRIVAQADSAAAQREQTGQWPNHERIDGRAVFLQPSHCFHNDEALQAISAYIGRRHWRHSIAERH